MSRIGQLVSLGTATFELSYLPQFLQIGAPDNTDIISQLSVQSNGESLILLNNPQQIDTLLKLENQILAAGASTEIGKGLVMSNGRCSFDTIITINNASATNTNVFERSIGKAPANGKNLRKVAVQPVIANGNVAIQNFDVIFFDPTNVDRVEVTYQNGWMEPLSTTELQGLYNQLFPSESAGLVNGNVVIAGTRRAPMGWGISKAVIYANSFGNVDVVVSRFKMTM